MPAGVGNLELRVGMVNDFPLELHNALVEIAIEYRLKFEKETHFEARNRELWWFRKSTLYRLNFEFIHDEPSILVFYYVDRFPIFPKLLAWCHDFIPMFPYYAKITWQQLPNFPLDLTKDEYKEKIKEIIKETNK